MSIASKLRKAKWALGNRTKAAKALNAAYKKSMAELEHEKTIEENAKFIRESEFFDADWYIRNHIELQNKDIDPAKHYLLNGASMRGRSPSPLFSGEEYWSLHWDVKNANMNPLLHYELHGKNEGREIYEREITSIEFPDESTSLSQSFDLSPTLHRRTAILSCFFADGIVPESLIYEIKGLREVVDNIVLVGDCKIIPSEIGKIESLVCAAIFERHEQYDFGSYKRGLAYAREHNLFEKTQTEELVFINDSCFGPIYPFSETFDPMTQSYCDFWGYVDKSLFGYEHIQSFFIVFKQQIIYSELLDVFLDRVDGTCDRGFIIVACETQLTKYLEDNGMVYDVVARESDKHGINLFNNPVTYLEQYRVPLIKKKALSRESLEDLDEVLSIINLNAPSLFDEAAPIVAKSLNHGNAKKHPIISLDAHKKSFAKRIERIADKVKNGQKIQVTFLVSSVSMFSSKPLFDSMLKDELFEPSIAIIPDFRKNQQTEHEMERCYKDLISLGYHLNRIMLAETDALGRWNDVCESADIVCYCLPYYQITSFRYNPYYSVGRDFLPIMVNYGYYRSLYDRKILSLDVYDYLWKAFFECEYTIAEYKESSSLDRDNADLVGYIKMDSLASAKHASKSRKQVLVALHHSIDGGANDYLSLANFIEHFDYFHDLPEKYPEIDFLFRPHPFLYDALKNVMKWTDYDIKAYLREMRSKPNVIWSNGGDYFQEFANSDACIQDCGSFLVEYFYTGKPCCYMLKSPDDIDAKFAPLGKQCLEQCYISYDTDAIDRFIEDVVLGGNDPKADGRAALAEKIMVNYPHAAEAALQSIKDAILNSKPETNQGDTCEE